MNRNDRGFLALTAEIFQLGKPGSISPAALIVAEDEVLVALVRSAPSVSIDQTMAYLTGGKLTVAGYCKIWEGRMDLLAGLQRIQVTLPELFSMELPNDLVVGIASSATDRLIELAAVAPDLALLVANVYDPSILRTELEMLGGLVSTPTEVLLQKGVLAQDDQAALLGLFLSDMVGTSSWHVLGLSFMSPVWRMLFVALAGPEHIESALATVSAVNSLTPSLA